MRVRPGAMGETAQVWGAMRTDRSIMAAPASCGLGVSSGCKAGSEARPSYHSVSMPVHDFVGPGHDTLDRTARISSGVTKHFV